MNVKMNSPRIFFIHATPVSMAPVAEAFDRLWPEATTMDLLDESLSRDLATLGEMNDEIYDRIDRLALHAVKAGATAILYTCSAFGDAIEQSRQRLELPVLKPNEAMFEQALQTEGQIGLAATFAPSIPSMAEEFAQMAASRNDTRELATTLIPDAMQRLAEGDAEFHHSRVAEGVTRLGDCDTVMLAQFSMSGARSHVESRVSSRILTSPDSAVAKLKSLI